SLLLVHDAPIAHAAALMGKPGTVVIAGTGSVGYGVNEYNDAHMIGGWGYLFGDEGSAFWLVRRVFEDAMREGVSGQGSELVATLLQRLEQPSLRAFARAFYSGAITRHMLAACAPEIFRAAEKGDVRAADYREACVTALVNLAIATSEALGMPQPPVAFAGGLVRDTWVRAAVRTSLAERYRQSRWVEPQYDPAVGALILAYRAAGLAHECITEAA
ncbi:MAG: hypothetical protein M3R35_03245, partial [Candidatus Eremiobacteraeota bacterium]|nr:hypothetical protein [Candidatus Eremiobacteraeota bacterium]